MKIKALVKFADSYHGNVVREIGDEFEATRERFNEIKGHGEYVEEVPEIEEEKTGESKVDDKTVNDKFEPVVPEDKGNKTEKKPKTEPKKK